MLSLSPGDVVLTQTEVVLLLAEMWIPRLVPSLALWAVMELGRVSCHFDGVGQEVEYDWASLSVLLASPPCW